MRTVSVPLPSSQHCHVLVEILRGQIGAVLPDDGYDFWGNRETSKLVQVLQRLEDFAYGAVIEPQADDEVADVVGFFDVENRQTAKVGGQYQTRLAGKTNMTAKNGRALIPTGEAAGSLPDFGAKSMIKDASKADD